MRPKVHTVIVQRPSSTGNDYGDWVPTYTLLADTMARVEPVRGRELMRADSKYSDVTHEVRLHNIDSLSAKDRMLYPGVYTTLVEQLDSSTGSVDMLVADGSLFPSAPFRVRVGPFIERETLFSVGESTDEGTYWEGYEVEDPYEILLVTAVTGDNSTAWTVSRAQDGSTQRVTLPGDDVFELVPLEIEAVLPHTDRRHTQVLARMTR